MELVKGEKVALEDGGVLTVLDTIGSGGQGTVYKVELNNKQYALKWYLSYKLDKNNVHTFRKNLTNNIYDTAPSECFLWPKHITEEYKESFGYVMDLRPKEFSDFSAILNNKVQFIDLHTMINTALHIVNSFRELHRKGKSYQDLNDGNFFVNTKTGAVLICDNDNVAPDGISLGIAGKPGYMAPEIVRGDKRPNALTDYHSLAVVLFKLFLRHDPLMGKNYVKSVCITEEVERELYGTKPVFIFDPNDQSNAPIPGVHPNPIKLWPLYPNYLKEAFIKSFCQGMRDPNARLSDNEWQTILIRLRGEIQTCTCRYQAFIHTLYSDDKEQCQCPKCKNTLSLPLILDHPKWPSYLCPGNDLYKCHTEEHSDDYLTLTGSVRTHKDNKNNYGIRNLSGRIWRFSFEDTEKEIKQEEVVPVRENTEVDFQNIRLSIKKA